MLPMVKDDHEDEAKGGSYVKFRTTPKMSADIGDATEPEGFGQNKSKWIKALIAARLRYIRQAKALNNYVPLIETTDWTPRPAVELTANGVSVNQLAPNRGWICTVDGCGRSWAPFVRECEAHRPAVTEPKTNEKNVRTHR